MINDILIRSTAQNWIVSIRRDNGNGKVATVPLAMIPRRAYAACVLAGAVTSAQNMFLADNVVIDTDRDGLFMLASLGIVAAKVAADAQAEYDAVYGDDILAGELA